MANKYSPGDMAFLVGSNRIIREVNILEVGSGFYTIRSANSNGGIKVKEHRLSPPKKWQKRVCRRRKQNHGRGGRVIDYRGNIYV